ncbi:hypothetical protein NLX83_01380 [Allokutzneria sp. A3M-2-11 16]|uniref:hypothetical protein n=1 Tax=Allokutzneria sp. A3M-2-11 16 TaxID=2962043 RepID=UPI0020B79AFE|nr:hypothetical protein [Allokutzneria sp. A3M-2-11 16]MCP3797900.1 hypothetical protein [Allokutzneria sp. A3M-2-11 16]
MRTITKRVLTLAATAAVTAGLALVGLPASAAPANPATPSATTQVDAQEQGEGEVESIVDGNVTVKLKTGVRVKLRANACIVIGGPLVEGVKVRLGVNLLGIRILVVL